MKKKWKTKMLNVILSSRSQKILKKVDKQLYQRLIKKIKDLANEPFPNDSKRVVGLKEKIYRVRVGDYRIQYIVFFENKDLLISNINKRERIYHR